MSTLISLAVAFLTLLGGHRAASDALRQTAPDYLLSAEVADRHLAASQLAGDAFGVDPALLLAIAWHESRYDPEARSREPGDRWSCGVMTPEPHAEPCSASELTMVGGYAAGAAHLRFWLDAYGGDVTKALRGYVGGGALVRRCEADGSYLVRAGVDACDVDSMFMARAARIKFTKEDKS